MELPSHKYLDSLKIAYKKMSFPTSTEKGAANVAKALGFRANQMVKSLIFETKEGEVFMILLGGEQNAVSGHLKKIMGSRDIKLASPEKVEEVTGYKIGSIPPFSWQKEGFRTLMEASLMKEKKLGVGTGQWGEEIIISPEDLRKASNAELVNLVEKSDEPFGNGDNFDRLASSKMETVANEELAPKHQINKVELLSENEKVSIAEISKHEGKQVTLEGWMYNKRSSGKIGFMQIRDGSGFVQAIIEKEKVGDENWAKMGELTIESSLQITGTVSKHPKKAEYELQVKEIRIIQIAPEFPIGKKEHGPEFLFDNRDLYLRSKTPWAVLRIRDQVFLSITNFYQEEGFIRFDTPILQPTSAEDTSQLFEIDYYQEKMYLTQSGQLYAEAGIMGLGKVYDFGPVFRAEKSKTRHHLSELWMMDAEMAFYNQEMNMDLQERMVKRIVKDVLENCKEELQILERDTTILQDIVKKPFIRMKHWDVKHLLKEEGFDVDFEDDMTTEEEIFLGNKFKLPIFIEDYPFAVKAFYMKSHTDAHDIKRARCADLIAPEEGREIIGGSQREDDYNKLLEEMKSRDYPVKDYEWYLNVRKYGSVPHSGFGIGLERTVRWLTGVHHIRETIAFPRTLVRSKP